jgi:hypothetical protein
MKNIDMFIEDESRKVISMWREDFFHTIPFILERFVSYFSTTIQKKNVSWGIGSTCVGKKDELIKFDAIVFKDKLASIRNCERKDLFEGEIIRYNQFIPYKSKNEVEFYHVCGGALPYDLIKTTYINVKHIYIIIISM